MIHLSDSVTYSILKRGVSVFYVVPSVFLVTGVGHHTDPVLLRLVFSPSSGPATRPKDLLHRIFYVNTSYYTEIQSPSLSILYKKRRNVCSLPFTHVCTFEPPCKFVVTNDTTL